MFDVRLTGIGEHSPTKKKGGRLLSETADSARDSSDPSAQPSGLSLYAASMRNLLPRLLSSAAVAAVAACFIGWGWALAWSCCVWANLWSSTALMGAAGRHKATRLGRALSMAVAANSVLGGACQGGMGGG